MSPKNDDAPDSSTDTAAGQEAKIEETKEQKQDRAAQLYQEGKRHYISNTFAEASKCLADACELFSELHGDFGVECADPYYFYGKALLELARLEPGVFGNALQGVEDEDSTEEEEEEGEEGETTEAAKAEKKEENPEEQQFEDANKLTEEQREEIREEVEDALAENAEALAQGKLPEETPMDAAQEGVDSTEATEETKEGEAEEGEEEGGEEGEGEGENKENVVPPEDAEEVSNLQLAWEMLDMARLICEKQEGEEWRMKTADCRLALGDVSIDDERYEDAVKEFEFCLQIQKDTLPSYDRRIAETYFQLGRALNLANKFGEAAENYKLSMAVLAEKENVLKASLEKTEEEEQKEKIREELAELATIIPDIQTKVDDCVGSQRSAEERKEAMAKENGESSGNGFANGSGEEKPVADSIEHLVRKPIKRKSATDEEPMAKKTKSIEENGSTTATENGHGEMNGATTNGHHHVEQEVQN